jgi:hypothetical protein
MSLLARYECSRCGGYTGYAGLRARQSKLRKHLACTCPSDAELDLRDKIERDLRFEMQRKDEAA